MTYPNTSIQSGNDNLTGIWVSIGFRSEGRAHDVIHIVGGDPASPQRAKMGFNPIYLERYDQKLSCYQGADEILVADESVTVTLNKIGQVALDLPQTLHFIFGTNDANFQKAKAIFVKMTTFASGRIIRVA